jgi:hypothetical protein
LDDSIGDTFVSSVREEVSFALIGFQDWLDGEKPCASGIKTQQSIRKYGQYHRPIARTILFWLNGDSFMPLGGLCQPSDDFGSKFQYL